MTGKKHKQNLLVFDLLCDSYISGLLILVLYCTIFLQVNCPKQQNFLSFFNEYSICINICKWLYVSLKIWNCLSLSLLIPAKNLMMFFCLWQIIKSNCLNILVEYRTLHPCTLNLFFTSCFQLNYMFIYDFFEAVDKKYWYFWFQYWVDRYEVNWSLISINI